MAHENSDENNHSGEDDQGDARLAHVPLETRQVVAEQVAE